MSGEKTQKATPRRREQALKDGNIWQPRELAPAVAVAVAALGFAAAGPWLWADMAAFLAAMLARAGDGDDVAALAVQVPLRWPLALAGAVAVMTIALAMGASRHVSLGLLQPKLAKISPVKGLQRLFSKTGLTGAATAILKLMLIAGVAAVVALPLLPVLANLGGDIGGLAVIGDSIARLLAAAALALAVIAAVDAMASWLLREQKLMMSPDEVKREQRQENGAPEVKAAIKRAQYAAAARRMRTVLADASVVVVNPVHFAVAMRYRPGADAAPVVLEKGQSETAQAIIAVARELRVPVIRTPRLARALYFTARVGAPVREELFAAVATILAFVMRFDAPDADAAPPVFVPPEFDFDERGARRKPGR